MVGFLIAVGIGIAIVAAGFGARWFYVKLRNKK